MGLVIIMDSLRQSAQHQQAQHSLELLQVLHITEQPRDIFWLYRNLHNQAQDNVIITSTIGLSQAKQILNKQHYNAIFIHCYLTTSGRNDAKYVSANTRGKPLNKGSQRIASALTGTVRHTVSPSSSNPSSSNPGTYDPSANDPSTHDLSTHDLSSTKLSTSTVSTNALDAITQWSRHSAIIAIIHGPHSYSASYSQAESTTHAKTNTAIHLNHDSKADYNALIEQLLQTGVDDYIAAEDMTTPLLAKLLHYSVERKQAKQHLQLNELDTITQLPNQNYFEYQLTRHLHTERLTEHVSAVLAVQLDHIARIESTNERATYHAYLQANGAKLQQALRQNDIIACANDGGFLIMLNAMPSMHTVTQVSAHIIETLGKALNIDGATLFSTASIGVSIQTPKGEDAKELIHQATQAAKLAQQQGGNRHCLFSLDQRVQASLNNQLTTELYKALQNDEFFLVFQPQINVLTQQLHGAEVLLRWEHPEQKTLTPYAFMSILESTGLITPVTEWIIHKAITQWQQWLKHNIAPQGSHLSINLSPSFLAQPTFKVFFNTLKQLPEALKNTIYFEITENLFVDPDSNISHLKYMKSCGFKLSMDDFGTGYSSLSYLKHFPLDCIKLDCTFTKEIVENPTDLAITQAVINLSRDLNIDLIAEGVENEATLALLKHMGCHVIQGYHFSKPLKPDDFQRFCRSL